MEKAQINGKIYCVHETVELMLLKRLQNHATVIAIWKEYYKVKELTLLNGEAC